MSKIAGIAPYPILSFADLNGLKQSLLLFDLVGFFALDNQLGDLKRQAYRYPVLGHVAHELKYLHSAGYLIEAMRKNETFSMPASSPATMDFLREGALIRQIQSSLGAMKQPDQKALKQIREAESRLACIKLNFEDHDFTAVPLIQQLKLPAESKAAKADVIRLVVSKMPIPDSQTPWEKVFEFKRNPDNQGRLSMLRDWMNKVVSSGRPVAEVNDELDALLYQYRKSLEIHKIKHQVGTLQTLIVGAAELFENVAKLKLSAIAKGLFSAGTAQADLYQTELTAPGNALAYLYKADEAFKR